MSIFDLILTSIVLGFGITLKTSIDVDKRMEVRNQTTNSLIYVSCFFGCFILSTVCVMPMVYLGSKFVLWLGIIG